MSLSDPMRDPDWDWTEDTTDTLYVTSYPDPIVVQRPYHDVSASVESYLTGTTGSQDIHPEDGWELVLREFGTSQYQVSNPFFILYNKHLGILRYFFFGNLVNEEINNVAGELFLQDNVHSPLFTLTDSTDQYLNNYDAYVQHTISEYYHDQWNFLDFSVTGFDPEIQNKYARFIIEISAYQQFDMEETGNINLSGTLGSGGSTHSQLLSSIDSGVDLYQNISKGFKDVKAAQEGYDEMLEYAEGNSDAWWSGPLASLATVGATNWIPALGPLVGVSRFIMGGGSSLDRQPTPVALTGGINLKGQIYNKTPISRIRFITPGSKVDDPEQAARRNSLPLYDQKPGLFNVNDQPYVTAMAEGWWSSATLVNNTSSVQSSETTTQSVTIPFEKPDNWNDYEQEVTMQAMAPPPPPPGDGGGDDDRYFNGYVRYDVSANYVYNTQVFSNLSVEGTMTYSDREAENFVPKSANGKYIFTLTFEDYQDYQIFIGTSAWKQYFDKFGIKATLTPAGAPSDVTPVTILKAFEPTYGPLDNQGVTE